MTFDIDRARRDTPGCQNVLHFNNAGSSLMPATVVEAVKDYLDREAAIGGYETVAERSGDLEHFYDAAAALIGCHRDEIAFVENATRAWDMAFYALARTFGPGDRILTAEAEYASNFIAFLQMARHTGATVEVIPGEESGQLSLDALKSAVDTRVKLIAISHVPTNGGLVNPAAGVGRIARDAGIPYLLDACQSVGQMPVDVEAIGCDMLSATGRKYLRGPRGTGFLYVRRSWIEKLEPPFLDLHAAHWTGRDGFEIRADARRFENFECNFAGKVGLGAAIDYAMGWGLEATYERLGSLAGRLRDALTALPGVIVRDIGAEKCGIVTFTVDGIASADIAPALRREAINVSVSRPDSTLLDATARNLPPLVRASVHYFNTEDEVERFCGAVGKVL